MSTENQTVSPPVCPTCERILPPEQAEIEYFARSRTKALPADEEHTLYEDAHKVLYFLGALAQAAPRAIAHTEEHGGQASEDWVMHLAWLAEELTEEAERRVERLKQAGLMWKDRVTGTDAQQADARKEGQEHAEKTRTRGQSLRECI
jgi:hypothetical protein